MAKEIREKKIEVNIEGRTVRIMAHMAGDVAKFGASAPRKIVKEPPKELMQPLKKVVLDKVELPKEEPKLNLPKTEFPKEPDLPLEPLNDPPVVPPVLKAEKKEIKKTRKARK